jgi:glucose-6-phosphate 1-dehydrogenase
VSNHTFVIFGGTGDLARRKLIPAVYRLLSGWDKAIFVGIGRNELGDRDYRAWVRGSLREAGIDDRAVERWCDGCVFYVTVPPGTGYGNVATRIAELEAAHGLDGNRVYYLALPPAAFDSAVADIGDAGLHLAPGWVRLVVEKPFGTDLDSARRLNELVHRYFAEEQVYRIDHYLGKETVQNLLVFRFANSLFEASWNRSGIASVEITVAESIGVEGRGAYYESAGVVRDIVQNHMAQLLALIAMEPPATYSPAAIRDEKVKVLDSLRPLRPDDVVFGQYAPGSGRGGYLDEAGVAADSDVATYVAMRLFIDNWRWQGVPFVLRSGKALPRRVTEVAVTFRDNPVQFFTNATADRLLITLQPDEGFEMRIDVKRPESDMELAQIPLAFSYGDEFGRIPDAYETLLADVVDGDQTLFVRADMVEKAWRYFAPALAPAASPESYPAGTWGPPPAARLLSGDGGWATD